MKKLLLMLALVSSPVFADSIQLDTSNLTNDQKLEIAKNIEQLKSQSTTNTLAEAEKWVGLGEKMGKVLGGVAKEVGVEVNDFVKTPVGTMTAGLIAWQYIGKTIVHLLGGLFMVGVVLFSVKSWADRLVETRIEYDTTKTNLFGNHPIISKRRDDISSEASFLLGLTGAIGLIASFVVMFGG